ncbi:MAG: ergothioneine biosynthesis protein EgtB [Myxococcales bacterium FL481]|nr:MAG: ergothioneine biosynthesis protein EgtB [Myxococcales bacterium FL481]
MTLVESKPGGAGLSERFAEVRARTCRLAASLSSEDQQIQAFDYASPTKWHLAHTTWFFETFVLGREPGHEPPFDPTFSVLFNSYYEGVGPQFARPQRGLLSRPSLQTVLAYRETVDREMVDRLRSQDEAVRADLVELGLQHEMQHQELLLTDILANLSVNPTSPAWRDETVEFSSAPATSKWIPFDAQLIQVGHHGRGFCFDNETPRHQTYVHPFELRSNPVTNAEVMSFIDDAGYRRPELWLSDGLAWVREHGVEAPAYWRRNPGEPAWRTFTLYGEQAVDPHAPATHLSGYEAHAIATWLGARLPTEQEWEWAATTQGGSPQEGRWLEQGPVVPRNSPTTSPFTSLWGETWEWTLSAYQPYPRYRPLAGAVGEYNGKFMANQLVLRGGSCATPANHVRTSYRNFFYPHQRWQFTGLRPARDAQ